MMLLGQRANGKSYQVKKTVLESGYKDEGKFIYLRRWKADISSKAVQTYFDDMPIEEITNNEFNSIHCYSNSIYLAKRDEEGNILNKKEIGKYCALNEAERYKSWAFLNYRYIDYEEFITDATYLVDEPRLLQQFVSTVARHSKITVLLVGNTLSRVCPYFSEWGLEGVLRQRIGTIELYHYHMEDGSTITVAVEYCNNANYENKMFFGNSAKQIVSGEWDTKEVPKFPDIDCSLCYELLIIYQSFKFVLQLYVDNDTGGFFCFVYPHTKNRDIQRVISDQFSTDFFVTPRLSKENLAELQIARCISQQKVTYSDNLTGADFKHVLDAWHII